MSLADVQPCARGKRRRVTSKGTPRHQFRYPAHKWDLAKAKAQRLGTSVTAVLAGCLDEWVNGEDEDAAD